MPEKILGDLKQTLQQQNTYISKNISQISEFIDK